MFFILIYFAFLPCNYLKTRNLQLEMNVETEVFPINILHSLPAGLAGAIYTFFETHSF
jgi:hypothetical protein